MDARRSASGTPDRRTLERALEACRTGHMAEAERLFRKLLRDCPQRIELHLSLAALLRERGELVEALDRLRRALALDGDRLDIRLQMGAVQFQLGRGAEAVATYREVVARAPNLDEACDVLAMALWRTGDLDAACVEFARFVALRPDSAEGAMNLGAILHERGRVEEAIAAYLRVLALDRNHAGAHENLGKALARLHESGRTEEAVRIAGDWRRRHPGNAWAEHLGAAVSGESPPVRASDAYLRAEFDGCAGAFEQRLAELGYDAPQRLAEALARELPAAAGALDVLDLGCGTGTAGAWLRTHARRLTGVDLARGMLELARRGGRYDELVAEEVGAYLRAHPAAYDLVFAADVLCYSGGLERILAGIAGALRPGGTVGFTVERDPAPTGFRLRPSGRYCHTDAYLHRTAADAGLDLLPLACAAGRREGSAAIDFTYAVARRPRTA